jgi:hypothetical protein
VGSNPITRSNTLPVDVPFFEQLIEYSWIFYCTVISLKNNEITVLLVLLFNIGII